MRRRCRGRRRRTRWTRRYKMRRRQEENEV